LEALKLEGPKLEEPWAVTIKDINQELANRGHRARRVKAPGYFYFFGGEAADWLDRTVRVPTLSSLTLPQWVGEFQRLKKLNGDIPRTELKAAKLKSSPADATRAESPTPDSRSLRRL
jgi:hypothetical protein